MVSTGDSTAIEAADLTIRQLGTPTVTSPLAPTLRARSSSAHYVAESDRVLLDDTIEMALARKVDLADLPALEPGGPRELLYFDPANVRVGIVTCGDSAPA